MSANHLARLRVVATWISQMLNISVVVRLGEFPQSIVSSTQLATIESQRPMSVSQAEVNNTTVGFVDDLPLEPRSAHINKEWTIASNQ